MSNAVMTEQDQEKYDNAMLELKVTRDRLKKYQDRQEHTKETEIEKARELIRSNQFEKAKIVLRQKKLRELYISNADKELSNLETMIQTMESKKIEMEMVANLKQTNEILKHMNELMPVEEVERLMDENEEQNDRLTEIGGLLAKNMAPAETESAEAEYEALLAELNGEGGQAKESSSEEYESESAGRVPQKQALPA